MIIHKEVQSVENSLGILNLEFHKVKKNFHFIQFFQKFPVYPVSSGRYQEENFHSHPVPI